MPVQGAPSSSSKLGLTSTWVVSQSGASEVVEVSAIVVDEDSAREVEVSNRVVEELSATVVEELSTTVVDEASTRVVDDVSATAVEEVSTTLVTVVAGRQGPALAPRMPKASVATAKRDRRAISDRHKGQYSQTIETSERARDSQKSDNDRMCSCKISSRRESLFIHGPSPAVKLSGGAVAMPRFASVGQTIDD